MMFTHRVDAGLQLAHVFARYRHEPVVVYGLVRGGVVLAAEVAASLNAPLDILVPRKIGHPLQPEYAIGAVNEDGLVVMGSDDNVDRKWLDLEITRQCAESRRMRELYRGDRSEVPVDGRTAIVTDDGIATGLTMKLAIMDVRRRNPVRVVVAVPVIPCETYRWLTQEADEVAALEITEKFAGAVGSYYEDFSPVEDEEVIRIMRGLKGAQT